MAEEQGQEQFEADAGAQRTEVAEEETVQEVDSAEGLAEDSDAASVEEGEPEQAVDEVTALCQELEEVKAREAEYLDGWQRARAELANARKRFQREQEQSYANARAGLLVRLLPILDDLERAFETLPEELSGQAWVEGVRLILHNFQALLEQEGVAPIEADGQEFDPYLHQAVTHEPSAEVPAGQVIGEMQRGYRLGERVLRPSVVRVSAGLPPESVDEDKQGLEEASPGEEQAQSSSE